MAELMLGWNPEDAPLEEYIRLRGMLAKDEPSCLPALRVQKAAVVLTIRSVDPTVVRELIVVLE